MDKPVGDGTWVANQLHLIVLLGRSSCHANLGRAVMNKFVGVLIVLLAGSLLIGCGGNADASTNVRVAQIGQEGCSGETGAAVSIVLDHQNGAIADNVHITYRHNGGTPQVLNGRSSGAEVITGPGGSYYIEVLKKGFRMESALVVVPYDESCRLLKQEVKFIFHPAACSDFKNVYVQVLGLNPSDVITVTTNFPSNNVPLKQQCPPGNCHFNLTLTNNGVYEVVFQGFSDLREPFMDAGVIRNSYPRTEIVIDNGFRLNPIISEGISTLNLKVPYKLGKSGCYEVFYEEITAEVTHLILPGSGFGGIRENSNLQVIDLTSPVCTKPQQDKTISFMVDLPAGTAETDVRVEYWLRGEWQEANCHFNNQYVCTATYPNPLIADLYHVRTIIRNQENVGAYIPLWNKCIFFE